MFKEVSPCIPTVGILYFGPFNPFHYSPLPLYLPHPFFNSFQYSSLYPLPSHLMFYNIIDTLIILFSFPSFPMFHYCMFYIWVCIWSCLFLCTCVSFGSIFHIWEKTCGLCVSEPGLLYLTWCPLIASIYLQAMCGFLMAEKNFIVYIYMFWSTHQM
jgi:hypothetical protein